MTIPAWRTVPQKRHAAKGDPRIVDAQRALSSSETLYHVRGRKGSAPALARNTPELSPLGRPSSRVADSEETRRCEAQDPASLSVAHNRVAEDHRRVRIAGEVERHSCCERYPSPFILSRGCEESKPSAPSHRRGNVPEGSGQVWSESAYALVPSSQTRRPKVSLSPRPIDRRGKSSGDSKKDKVDNWGYRGADRCETAAISAHDSPGDSVSAEKRRAEKRKKEDAVQDEQEGNSQIHAIHKRVRPEAEFAFVPPRCNKSNDKLRNASKGNPEDHQTQIRQEPVPVLPAFSLDGVQSAEKGEQSTTTIGKVRKQDKKKRKRFVEIPMIYELGDGYTTSASDRYVDPWTTEVEIAPLSANVIDLEKIGEIVGKVDPKLAEVLRALNDSKLFEETFLLQDAKSRMEVIGKCRRNFPRTECPREIVKSLENMSVLRDLNRRKSDRKSYPGRSTTPKAGAKIKFVPKRGKGEEHLVRIIYAYMLGNKMYREPPPMPIPLLHELVEEVMEKRWLFTFDFRSWFYQFLLGEDVSKDWFGVLHEKLYFAFQRMPMGWCWAPYIATATALALVKSIKPDAYVAMWVDDGLLASSDKEKLESIKRQLQVFFETEAGVDVKHYTAVSQRVEYVGLELDTRRRRWRLKQSWREKFCIALQNLVKIERGGVRMKLHAVQKLAGLCQWAISALGDPQLDVWNLSHLTGELTANRKLSPRTVVEVPNCCIREVKEIVRRVKEGKWRRLCRSWTSSDAIIATDACDLGGGCVFSFGENLSLPVDVPCPRVLHAAWNDVTVDDHINLKELKAVTMGIESMPSFSRPTPVGLIIDNRVVFHWLQKGKASASSRTEMRRLLILLRKKRIHLVPRWVPSAQQPADKPSRGETTLDPVFDRDHMHYVFTQGEAPKRWLRSYPM